MSFKLIKKADLSSDILVFSLFGLYSLTLAPSLNKFLTFGEENSIVGIAGMIIYVLEIFAFRFKLYAIRIRAEARRNEIKQNSGQDRLLPRTGFIVWCGVFARILFRMGILYLSIRAIGISTDGRDENRSIIAPFVLFVAVFFEFFLSAVLMIKSGLFNPEITYPREEQDEIDSYEAWRVRYTAASQEEHFYLKELLSDVVLNIYAFMLFNGIWDRINTTGVGMIDNYYKLGKDPYDTGINVFSWLFFVILFALPTLRLANWIEGKVTSFDDRGQWNTRLAFFVAALITIAPTIEHFYNVYFGAHSVF